MGMFRKVSSCSCQGSQPNPNNFEILYIIVGEFNTLAKVRYPGCTTFEGIKILVYRGIVSEELQAAKCLDPHFCDKHKTIAPFARFEPTEAGLKMATELLNRNIPVEPQPGSNIHSRNQADVVTLATPVPRR